MADLRVVKPGDKPGKPEGQAKMSVVEAAASGSQRALLVAMRDRIAKAVANEGCPPRDLASLTKRLDDIAEKIRMLDVQAEEDSADGGSTPDEKWDAEAL